MSTPGPELRKHIADQFRQMTGLSDIQARDMEIGVFNHAIETADRRRVMRSWKDHRFASLYRNKAISLMCNLQNPKLLARLQENEFKPHDLAFMKHDNMCPDMWTELIDQKMRREENMLNTRRAVMTTQFTCGKCKKNECSFYEMQTRSADEPMTIFVNCCNCGNRWRMG